MSKWLSWRDNAGTRGNLKPIFNSATAAEIWLDKIAGHKYGQNMSDDANNPPKISTPQPCTDSQRTKQVSTVGWTVGIFAMFGILDSSGKCDRIVG